MSAITIHRGSAGGASGLEIDKLAVLGTTTLSGAVSLGGTLAVAGTVTFNAFTVSNALAAGSNAIPWNAAWDAEVQSEVDDALQALGYTATVADRIDVAVSTRLATAGYTAPLSAASIATAVEGIVIETGYDLGDTLRIVAAAVAGAETGGPGSPVFVGLDGVTTRIAGTADSSGNRSGVTYSP